MLPRDLFATAMEALRTNTLRSALTTLGIVIGVAALVAMMGVGEGAQARVDSVISSLGSNLLTIVPGNANSGGANLGAGTRLTITEGDAAAIAARVDGVLAAAPVLGGNGQVINAGVNWNTQLQGVSADYAQATGWTLAEGRWLDVADIRGARSVAMLGRTTALNLFPNGGAVGQAIRINRVPVTVIGVLATKGQTAFGRDQDDVLMLPISAARRRVLGATGIAGDAVTSIAVQVAAPELLTQVETEVRALLRERHRLGASQTDDFDVRNLAQFINARADTLRTFTMLMAVVAAISLLVGGIGIMNIMLVSVTERTREIGLRMALGATGADVQRQFVVESVALSVLGGLLGLLLGLAITAIASVFTDFPMRIQWNSALIATVFAAATGLVFGWWPARRAAALDPIEALRRE